MEEKTADVIIQPAPDAKEPLSSTQLKIFTMDMILRSERGNRGKGIAELLERSTQESWLQSPDNRLKLLYYDFHLASYKSETENIRRSFLEKPITPAATERIEEIVRKTVELKTERDALQPQIDEELRSENIIEILAKNFVDPQKPWVIGNIEKDPVNSFYWVINSYDGERRMLAWIRQNGIDDSLADFFQDKHDERLFDHIENFRIKTIDSEDKVGIESGVSSLVRTIFRHRYDSFPLEVVRKFKGLMDNPDIYEEFSQILQLTSEKDRRIQSDRFKRGEIDFLPNIQENLRPILLVDLYGRLLKEASSTPIDVFQKWHQYWRPETRDEERKVKFIELLLDGGYSNLRDFSKVEPADRAKIIERLRYLISPKPDEEKEADRRNHELATTPIEEIQIDPQTLFHETDFSLLPQVLSSGVFANEVTYQSRNAASGHESDLSTSFWRLDIEGNVGRITLKKAIELFYPPKGTRVIKTAANLENRVVICSLNPKAEEDKDFFLYPPYSDLMHQYDSNAPLAKKFTAGWDENHTPTQYTDIKKDAVFVLLGLSATRFNFVFIPPNLKDRYTKIAETLSFYLPAFSAETGEKLF